MSFVIYPAPRELSELAPRTASICLPFSRVLGHSSFCDLFLQNQGTGEIAIFVAADFVVVGTGQYEPKAFVSEFLADDRVISEVLRPNDMSELSRRLGTLADDEGYFPVPHPALGGTQDLASFDKGNLFVHVEIIATILE